MDSPKISFIMKVNPRCPLLPQEPGMLPGELPALDHNRCKAGLVELDVLPS